MIGYALNIANLVECCIDWIMSIDSDGTEPEEQHFKLSNRTQQDVQQPRTKIAQPEVTHKETISKGKNDQTLFQKCITQKQAK